MAKAAISRMWGREKVWDSEMSKEKDIEEIRGSRAHKAKLEHVSRDTTKHRKTEETLQAQKGLYWAVMENAYFGFTLIDVNYRVVIANSMISGHFHKPASELIGRECFRAFKKRDSICPNCPGKRAMASGQPAEIEVERVLDDGSCFSASIQAFPTIGPDGNVTGFIEIVEDTTERKKTEKALQESEERYQAIFEQAADSIVLVDAKTKTIVDFNNKAHENLGYSSEDFQKLKISDIDTCESEQEVAKHIEKVLTEEAGTFETKHRTKNGEIRDILINTKVISVGGRDLIQGIWRDITEHKKAEEKLQKERDKAQKYLDVAAVILVAIDAEQRVGLINKRGCEILGYSEDEILGKNWFNNFLPERIRGDVKKIFDKILAGKAKGPEYYENPVLTKNGDKKLIAWRNTILRDDKGEVIAALSSGEDITQRRQAEQKLLNYQRQLKSLASQLTLTEENERYRIATELHSTISQSMIISKIKLDELRASAPSGDIAKMLDEVCELLNQTIQESRSLIFDLSSPILYELGFEAAVAEWLSEQIQKKHNIATEFEKDKHPKPLEDDIRVLLFRSVRELLINVVKHTQAKKIKVSIRKVGNEMHVSVEDDGWGFDPKQVAATAVRKGGFGLFSIRERLEQLGGHLEIESAPGCGTNATLIAPLKQKETNRR